MTFQTAFNRFMAAPPVKISPNDPGFCGLEGDGWIAAPLDPANPNEPVLLMDVTPDGVFIQLLAVEVSVDDVLGEWSLTLE